MNLFLALLLFSVLTLCDSFSLQSRHFFIRMAVNLTTKIVWFGIIYLTQRFNIKSFLTINFLTVINISMLLCALLSLQEDNSKRFFALSNVVQMSFFTTFYTYTYPSVALIIISLLFIAPNLYFLSIMSILEKQTGQDIVYIESCWGLFNRNKIYGAVALTSLLILSGIPICFEVAPKYAILILTHEYDHFTLFWINCISFAAMGYAYMRWMLSVLLNKQIPEFSNVKKTKTILENFLVSCCLIQMIFTLGSILLRQI